MDRELVLSVTRKDLDIETFRAGGKGGQKQNKTSTGVRIRHRASGAVGESRKHRTQLENKRAAFLQMARSKTFEDWRKLEVARLAGREAADRLAVERAMRPKNLKVEVKDENGRWTPAPEDLASPSSV